MECERETYCKCLYYASNALSRKITRMAEKAYKPLGMAPSYAFILMTVIRRPGVNAGEIASIMQLQPSTVTRFIEKLEKEKYIQRIQDGKYVAVYPLKRAHELETELKKAWLSLYHEYTSLLGEEEAVRLTAGIYDASRLLPES